MVRRMGKRACSCVRHNDCSGRRLSGVQEVGRKVAGYPPPAKAQFVSAKKLRAGNLYRSLFGVGDRNGSLTHLSE
jgi:hypothetical protein